MKEYDHGEKKNSSFCLYASDMDACQELNILWIQTKWMDAWIIQSKYVVECTN
jgi:hypothetical protein